MEARKQSSCVECEQKRSTRKCDQCGDGFCTRCFRKAHAGGRRAKHTWTHVGPMECAECEAEVREMAPKGRRPRESASCTGRESVKC